MTRHSINNAIAATQEGPFYYLEKPFTPEQLLETVKTVLGQLLLSKESKKISRAMKQAVDDQKGFLETADKGSIFLDEIGEMPHSMKVKLLQVLPEIHRFSL